MKRRHTRTALGAVALLAMTPVGLAACSSGDGGTSATGTSSASASGSASGSASATGSATSTSGSPSAAASSAPVDAPAATGTLVTLTGLSLHLPEGWQTQATSPTSANGFDPQLDAGEGQLMIYDDSSLTTDTVDSAARYALKSDKSDGTHRVRGADQTVGGVQGYVITGSSKDTPTYFEFGTVTQGRTVKLIIQFLHKTADPQTTIDSILASVTWG